VFLKRYGLRAEAKSGAHDEDMIIGGLYCHLLETVPWYAPEPEAGSVRLARDLGVRLKPQSDDEHDPFEVAW
jgi:hypothetical protein